MAVGCVAGRITSAILVWIAAGTAVGPRTSALVRACSYPRSLVERGLVGRVRSQGLLAAAGGRWGRGTPRCSQAAVQAAPSAAVGSPAVRVPTWLVARPFGRAAVVEWQVIWLGHRLDHDVMETHFNEAFGSRDK